MRGGGGGGGGHIDASINDRVSLTENIESDVCSEGPSQVANGTDVHSSMRLISV